MELNYIARKHEPETRPVPFIPINTGNLGRCNLEKDRSSEMLMVPEVSAGTKVCFAFQLCTVLIQFYQVIKSLKNWQTLHDLLNQYPLFHTQKTFLRKKNTTTDPKT